MKVSRDAKAAAPLLRCSNRGIAQGRSKHDWVVVSYIFFIFNPKIGEDEPILTHIFQMGWFNHQLDDKS